MSMTTKQKELMAFLIEKDITVKDAARSMLACYDSTIKIYRRIKREFNCVGCHTLGYRFGRVTQRRYLGINNNEVLCGLSLGEFQLIQTMIMDDLSVKGAADKICLSLDGANSRVVKIKKKMGCNCLLTVGYRLSRISLCTN